jgi:PLP dependent protein
MTVTTLTGYSKTRKAIGDACAAAGRPASAVRLIAVSKTQEVSAILPLLGAGQVAFGENRVQEAQAKWPDLKVQYPRAELHLIGPLQTNKVEDAVALFDVIQTVDRLKLVQHLAQAFIKQKRKPKLMLQVNTGLEQQKAGLPPNEAASFIQKTRDEFGLNFIGLMCIPPVGEDPTPHFSLLAQIAARNGLSELSMGMSGDYETAIKQGATMVRIGSAIFGERKSHSPVAK